MLRYRVHIQVFVKDVTLKIDPVDDCTPDTRRVPLKVYEMYVGPILYALPSFRLAQWSCLLPDILLGVSPLRLLHIHGRIWVLELDPLGGARRGCHALRNLSLHGAGRHNGARPAVAFCGVIPGRYVHSFFCFPY